MGQRSNLYIFPETNELHLNMDADGWQSFLLGGPAYMFRGELTVNFLECIKEDNCLSTSCVFTLSFLWKIFQYDRSIVIRCGWFKKFPYKNGLHHFVVVSQYRWVCFFTRKGTLDKVGCGLSQNIWDILYSKRHPHSYLVQAHVLYPHDKRNTCPMRMCVCAFRYLAVFLHICLSFYLCIYLSIYRSLCLSLFFFSLVVFLFYLIYRFYRIFLLYPIYLILLIHLIYLILLT